MSIQENIISSIPKHLQQFVEEQNYARYTAQDHAVWRYIMRRQLNHLSRAAHPVYVEGLKKTGISIEHIPSIEEMNHCLAALGWRAVVVDGLIPPTAFMEFHAHRILPIALDMRLIDHILYTPAPDIVHEAAGHAPFLADVDYSEFLQKFGEYGVKALYYKPDYDIYEMVRYLSQIKEHAKTTPAQIRVAERRLKQTIIQNKKVSEAKRLTRLYWWTAEYGLVGSPRDYKIFGAGLLSSMGESRTCLDDKKVKKIPLTLGCLDVDYDITKPQLQLFVTRSCLHMRQILEELADTMAFRRGGTASLKMAIAGGVVATAEYSSGLQVSGVLTKVMTDPLDNEVYLNTTGPTQLAYKNVELPGHSITYHSAGFGSPVGRIQNIDANLEDLTVDELKAQNIQIGREVKLHFLSGIKVKGKLTQILRRDGRNILFTFENCRVTDLQGKVLFDPAWGVYDMAVGRRVVSVCAGAADRDCYDTYPKKSQHKTAAKKFGGKEKSIFDLYQRARDLRETGGIGLKSVQALWSDLKKFPDEWLVRDQLLEMAQDIPNGSNLTAALTQELALLKKKNPVYAEIMELQNLP